MSEKIEGIMAKAGKELSKSKIERTSGKKKKSVLHQLSPISFTMTVMSGTVLCSKDLNFPALRSEKPSRGYDHH